MVHLNMNFRICVSLFGWKENILPKQHIVQCAMCMQYGRAVRFSLPEVVYISACF